MVPCDRRDPSRRIPPRRIFDFDWLLGALVLGLGLSLAGSAGCAHKEQDVIVATALSEPMVFAVAPVLDFTGTFALDPLKAADLLASELTFVDGATVLPVSRIAAILTAQGKLQIESPDHAVEVARLAGADAIIVAGVTEYDPYTPTIGVAVQLYRAWAASAGGFDARTTSRAARAVSTEGEGHFDGNSSLLAQTQVIYNGTHAHVTDLIKAYARHRQEELQMGWRQYLKVQTLFIRFCWHDALTRLLSRQPCRDAQFADVEATETYQ